MQFSQYNIERANYTDTDGITWLIYKINEFVNGYPSISFYVQKEDYGIIEMAFGVAEEERDNVKHGLYDAQICEYIESVKDNEQWN